MDRVYLCKPHAYFATNPYGSFERALKTIAVRNGIKGGMLWGAIGSLIMALLLISIIIESVSGVYLLAGCYLLFIILMGVWYFPYTIFRVITRKEAIGISEHIKIAMYVGVPMIVFNIITEMLSNRIFGDVVSHGFWRHLQIHEYLESIVVIYIAEYLVKSIWGTRYSTSFKIKDGVF